MRLNLPTGPGRELAVLGLALLAGLLLMPAFIWTAGRLTLGTYANGSVLHAWPDFFRGLGDGSLAFWIVLLAPYALVWIWRLLRFGWRRTA